MQKLCVGWGVVPKCNLSCEFCGTRNSRLKGKTIGYNDWIKFIDNNHDYIYGINYGAGENTMSLDWFRLIEYIRDKYPKIKQSLNTNGFLIEQVSRDKSLREIAIKSLDEVDVSVDFVNENKHCALRGNKNVHKWALGTLEFCQNNDIFGSIAFIGGKPTLNKKNIDGIFGIAKKYSARLRMNLYRPLIAIEEIDNKFIASYKNIIDILYHIDKNYKILSLSDPLFSSILTNGHYKIDHSGINSIRVLHNGKITPSPLLMSKNFQKYDVREINILKKLKNNKAAFKELYVIPHECVNCVFCETCKGGVYDRRYLWYKSFMKRDPYCPFNKGNFLPENKVTIHEDKKFQSVHEGYFPTMFFSN